MKKVLSSHVPACQYCCLVNSSRLLANYQKCFNYLNITKRQCKTQAAYESNKANNSETKQNPASSGAEKTTTVTDENRSKNDESVISKEQTKSSKTPRPEKLMDFFENHPHIMTVKSLIPKKYLSLKRSTPPDILYLIDPEIAETSVKLILPKIKDNENQMICETNAGLGMLTRNLLDNGVKLVRMYESCSEFKTGLKKLSLEHYPGRAELFTKNIYHLGRYDYLDRHDQGNRVEQLLLGVSKKEWNDDPAMTIIGPMPDNKFILYLMRCLALQSYLVSLGRIQLFAFMKPRNYVVLTAGPENDLQTYQACSVLSHLLFDVELLEKFPRKAFLPWEKEKVLSSKSRYYDTVDPDSMYLVRMTLKKELPVSKDQLLHLHAFVRLSFNNGLARKNKRIIRVVEKWVPGSGLRVIVPMTNHPDYFSIGIFTKFGQLTPRQILYVFQEMAAHPGYNNSPFLKITEDYLLKSETTTTEVNDRYLEEGIVPEKD